MAVQMGFGGRGHASPHRIPQTIPRTVIKADISGIRADISKPRAAAPNNSNGAIVPAWCAWRPPAHPTNARKAADNHGTCARRFDIPNATPAAKENRSSMLKFAQVRGTPIATNTPRKTPSAIPGSRSNPPVAVARTTGSNAVSIGRTRRSPAGDPLFTTSSLRERGYGRAQAPPTWIYRAVSSGPHATSRPA